MERNTQRPRRRRDEDRQGQQERQAGQRRTAADSGGQTGQQMQQGQQGQPVQMQGREAGAADAAMDNSRASAEVVRRQQADAAAAASAGTPSAYIMMQGGGMPDGVTDAAGGIRPGAFGGLSAEGAEDLGGRGPVPEGQRRITKAVIDEAWATLMEYKEGKANLDARIVENEQWFKLRHWETMGAKERPGELMSRSAWLFNSLLNRHADAMDSYPKPNILPREESDREEASRLTSILPVVLDRTDFEQTYSDVWWYKLKSGTGAYGVFWDTSLADGLGDISIKKLDILNLFWQPGISDIQESRNLFIVSLVDRDILEQNFPQMRGKAGGTDTITTTRYQYDDNIDTTKKACVVDWYYKVGTGEGGKHVLQYCKFCDGVVLYASEDQAEYRERGYYDHGEYPVILDGLFPVEGSPASFGYLDIMKNPQLFIDTLTGAMVKSAKLQSEPKFMMREDFAGNEEEFLDGRANILHVAGNIDDTNFRQITVDGVDGNSLNVLTFLVDELKETSGNRDFSQGTTTSGVTAASAIAALQEAGSKTARDMNKSAYRAFREIIYLCIELIRQFYSLPRQFRIVGDDGMEKFIQYSNQRLQERPINLFGATLAGQEMLQKPVFDVKVTAEKASPFSTVSQNDLAKELYSLGFFNPQLADQALAALEMMDFDSKTMVQRRIQQNGTMYQQLMAMQQTVAQLATIVDAQNGTGILAGMQQAGTLNTGEVQAAPSGGATGSNTAVDAFGGARSGSATSTAGQARARAAELATPR